MSSGKNRYPSADVEAYIVRIFPVAGSRIRGFPSPPRSRTTEDEADAPEKFRIHQISSLSVSRWTKAQPAGRMQSGRKPFSRSASPTGMSKKCSLSWSSRRSNAAWESFREADFSGSVPHTGTPALARYTIRCSKS